MSKLPFRGNIERLTVENNQYRKILHTTQTMQLVVMSILPGREIGGEIHPRTSQFIRVDKGKAAATIGNNKYRLKDGDAVVIPPGFWHNIRNTGTEPLKLYTIYSPPEHAV